MKASFKHLLVTLTILLGGAAYSYAQPTVQGRVTDSEGLPLPGVAVLVSGTSNGTMTDENGNYSLSGLKKGDLIIFSSLGLGDQQFDCDGSLSKLNVIETYVKKFAKGGRNSSIPALRALSTIIFVVMILVIVIANLRASKRRDK